MLNRTPSQRFFPENFTQRYVTLEWPHRANNKTGALPLPSEVSHFRGQGDARGQPREETRAVGARCFGF